MVLVARVRFPAFAPKTWSSLILFSLLKKKSVFSFIANKFVIKDENPSHGDLKQPEVSVKRDPKESFFNLIWKVTLSGILKTTGIPEKYAK